MSDLSRRSFVASVAAGSAALSPSLSRASRAGKRLADSAPPDADLILLNGKVITVDPRDTIAEAVAVSGGKITAVGSTQDIRALSGANTRIIDLGGKCVTPGLVDSHLHLIYYGQQYRQGMLDVRFPKARSKQDLLQLVAGHTRITTKGQWIVGNQGFSLNVDGVPSLAELDAVAAEHPVYLKDRSGQFSLANSIALRDAGITRDTPDPLNAKIGRDTNGAPNGLLFHYPAEQLIQRRIPAYGVHTAADVAEGQRRALEAGYTSAQDVIVTQKEVIDTYRAAERAGSLKMRLYLMRYFAAEQQLQAVLAREQERFSGECLTFGGWKLAIDGGGGAGTQLMYDRSLPVANRSYPFFEQDVLNRMVLQLHRTGLQIAIHAVGDRAVDMAINAYEAALQASPRPNHRHRIEHALFVTPQAVERIRKLGIVISTQPQWILFHGEAQHTGTSDAAMQHFFPLRTMMNMGIPVAFGCDVPATIMVEPRYAFMGAVVRGRGGYVPAPEQRISIRDALRMHTMGSAYASFDEHVKGSIEPGKMADFVVWSHDLYSATPREFAELKPLTTIVGGQVVFGG